MADEERSELRQSEDPLPSSSNRGSWQGQLGDVTEVLSAIEQGDGQAAEQLLPLVYEELRKLAAARMAQEKSGQTLQATALVHEAYIRLISQSVPQRWDSRRHFFAAAAEAMRRILVERARHRETIRAGGNLERIELTEEQLVAEGPTLDLLALNEALERLEQEDPRKAQLVKLRFFAGLTISQTAQVLGVSVATAKVDWAYAKSWLGLALNEGQ